MIRDLAAAVGIVGIVTGLYQAWEPLAWIVGGGLLLGAALGSWILEQQRKRQ